MDKDERVYVVFHTMDYEGGSLRGIYSTSEAAKKMVLQYMAEHMPDTQMQPIKCFWSEYTCASHPELHHAGCTAYRYDDNYEWHIYQVIVQRG